MRALHIILAALALLACAACSRRVVAEATTTATATTAVRVDTVRVIQRTADTIRQRDSVIIERAGDTIRIRYSEKLSSDGSLYTANLRDARSEDLYICHGREQDSFTPSFVYHGFRYVEISGPVRIEPSAIVAPSI